MKKTFKADMGNLYEMIGFIKEYAVSQKCPKELLANLELAIEEALVNIIEHGYPKTTGEIEITTDDSDTKRFIVEIKDHGIAYNPLEQLKIPDEETPLLEKKSGGLGLFIISSIVESTTYNRMGQSNILRFNHPISP